MKSIQIDMFEVQLGASILIQINTPDGNVNILADGGINAKGYERAHVAKKIPGVIFNSSSNNKTRIDLMIGTHYDKDHLYGLIDVVKNKNFEIGEAWLPPVANDAEVTGVEEPLIMDDILAHQFAFDMEGTKIKRYLSVQKERCVKSERIINGITNNYKSFNFETFRYQIEEEPDYSQSEINGSLFEFYKHLYESDRLLPEKFQGYHVDVLLIPEDKFLNPFLEYPDFRLHESNLESLMSMITYEAFIRKSAAKKAITAKYLNDLVKVLINNDVDLRTLTIEEGNPEFYIWNSTKKCFIKTTFSSYRKFKLPKITILGPSKELVKKHRDIIPRALFLTRFPEIERKYITASNQLSYVMIIEYLNQKILITGDAGFVDFKNSPSEPYFPNILNALDKLDVIQIAHHGGNNVDFYKVLLQSSYIKNKKQPSFHLLSHATNDKHRPSLEYSQFVEYLENNKCKIKLLFTSIPKKEKVKLYKQLIHPTFGQQAEKGDVRLTFRSGKWAVEKHAIQI